jgi:thiamine biosynthesis lipoprotein
MLSKLKKLCVGLIALTLLISAAPPLPLKSKLYVSNYENVLGTSMEIKIAANTELNATKAENIALAEIDRLNKILSGYDPASEFNHWVATAKKPQVVSPELYEVLSLFEQWRTKTNGALDPAAETVGKVWREAAIKNQLPSSSAIADAVNTLHQQQYVLNKQNRTAQHIGNAPLMLNSFAKSFIMDKAANAAMSAQGVTGLVINIGGDILVRGKHTEQIQVSNPKADAENDAPVAMLNINNKTIATSGNYRRGELINGKWYSHIVDPRTGQPVSHIISASVIANNATDAGALATTLNVVSPEEGKKLVASVPGAEYFLITADGKQIESKGWKNAKLTVNNEVTKPAPYNAKDKLWDPKYELAINLELATIRGFRMLRPFVAIWVVDEDKKPVKQIALWYNKPKYLSDMRSWYATYRNDFYANSPSISSTTSATRSPGKYTLKWDGKDDKGNLVKEGTYTVYIEVAREHGTHQLITQAITPKKPEHIDLQANTEVASASLDYRKKEDGN